MVSIPRVVIKEKDNNRMHQVFSPSSQKIVFYCPHGAKKKKKNHLLTQMSNHEAFNHSKPYFKRRRNSNNAMCSS